MSTEYRSDNFERMTQRFVNPIFVKDEMGNIRFSSTMTFVKYSREYFCIFAAHAIPNKDNNIDSMGYLSADGEFVYFNEIIKSKKIFNNHDIVICNTFRPLHLKNYFDLDQKQSFIGIHKNLFSWVGFPAKKAKKQYHKTQSSKEHIIKDVSFLDDGVAKWNNAEYLIITSKIESHNNIEISGYFENKKIDYKYSGFKEKGYSLKGMSGGAFFFEPKDRVIDSDLNKKFQFAGIGLEYQGEKLIKGASRVLIINLLKEYIENNSSEIHLELLS